MKNKEWLLTPKVTAHCTGQKYPKDIYYRQKYHDKPKYRITLCMPDGFLLSFPIFEGEDANTKIKEYIDNWYKVTKPNPDLYDHFVIKERCPRCGGELRAKMHQDNVSIWCTNYPDCDYQELRDNAKALELIFEEDK